VLRPGQLTGGWRWAFIVCWGCVPLALLAVSASAWKMGLSMWWTGPRFAPRPLVVQVLPAVPAVLLVVLAARNVRFLPYLGAIAAIVLAAVGTGDLGRFEGLALAQLAIAGAALCVSLASFAGLLQRAEPG
jgi:hypothetical protein